MSAFMCNARTISIVADVMTKHSCSGISIKSNFFYLVGMNIDALKARYKEVNVDADSFKFVKTEYSLVEAIKCIDCYLYQCTEGEIPTWYMFKVLTKIRNKLIIEYMHEKIMNSPEYEALPWE